ncbi:MULTISPECIES: LysR family transcriptional regulator [Afifella]|uniref:Transcriptional regulator, LysR family n=1 Tax=Afifella marina DSM 2698 TaxID=1120955 RepID=A0A1G5P1Q3_AFIMA|nr:MULTISPECIES: LysR family transcriptional regulator [Afifella]MBK1624253.1 LysR family transcriptional regulator [Afifella marina DSM 2698]MBK1627986.1 LysR family transcriptional regulator [Afifella marina]MBK5918180.1 LysR family transcriptional regulator [Afifella marina]MCT8266175.1 LysR family transcriptional regulator [Afifella sp. JA880]RAI19225.1 LysR family transcriptional regulator [Afifella marina DSM 2698]
MDWDKLRIFHAAAEAGSFTHAGDSLNMSQSAVSRQVSALESELGVPLFHRHARGLILTEQGELLVRTAREVLVKLEQTRAELADSKGQPSGALKVTTTVGLGSSWLASRLNEFIDLYPQINLQVVLDDDELDLSMREADVAIRLRAPTQPDLIQRKLFTVHFHVYASPDYLQRFGQPKSVAELDEHRIIVYGENAPAYLRDMNLLMSSGRENGEPRTPIMAINNVVAIRRAIEKGLGIAMLPDYLVNEQSPLVAILPEAEVPAFDTYFVYAEELRNSARVQVFRDFLIAMARRWHY